MLSRLAIRRRVTTMMITMMVFLAGIVSYMNLDMNLMPEMDIPIVVVSTTYVGAGPEEIENLVTKPLEESLSTVSNVENITSVSSANMSMVMVQFVDGTDIDIASMDLRDIIDRTKSTLPDDANEPIIIKMDMNAVPIYMGATAENMDLTALNEMLEDNVVNRLERIEGVASVDLTGGVEREVRITVDPDKLAGYGLTTSQLSQVLSAENMNLPSGSLSQGSTNVQVRTMGEFEDIEDIKNLPVTTPGGALIHLSDVASVEEKEVDRDSFSIIDGNYGIILEVNCQTDFVAKDAGFQAFADKVLDAAVAGKITDVEVLKAQFEEERVALVAKIGENINIRRVAALEGDVLGSYQHGARIGVLVAAKGADEELVKHIAMHVAASKPEFIKPEDVSAEVVEKEYQVQLDIAMQSGKPKEIAEKMVEGRMKKFTGEVSLTGQPFVMEPSKTVGQLLKEHNAEVTGFIRFEVGEGIEKVETDFAAEVAAMSKQS